MPDRFAAQVLLEPAADPAADGARAQRAFAALGFTPGALVGGNFAIEARAGVFGSVFGVTLRARAGGRVEVYDRAGHAVGGHLPLSGLPPSLQPLIAAVLFTEPPAFGPGSFA